LAEIAGMSISHFIRCFRNDIGQSPAEYVLEQRISTAAHQLANTRRSIEKVARSTGFGNRFYFTRAFTRLMGVPPGTYRKLPTV
jgi:AraC family transcriptional regulator